MSIVVADETVMREAPDPTRREMPTLHAGLRVVIVKESDGWVLVRLANSTEGWVVKDAVEEI
jgi:SH3-like domain-containing protein